MLSSTSFPKLVNADSNSDYDAIGGHIELADADEVTLFDEMLKAVDGCDIPVAISKHEGMSENSMSDDDDDIIGYLGGGAMSAETKELNFGDLLIKNSTYDNYSPVSINGEDDKDFNSNFKKVAVNKGGKSLSVLVECVENAKYSRTGNITSKSKARSANSKCQTRNAVAARENREKKKMYVHQLEQGVKDLTAELRTLREKSRKQETENKTMMHEISYLRKVIENETGLSSLLKTFLKTPGIKFKSFVSQPDGEKVENEWQDELNEQSGDNKRKGIYLNNACKKQRVSVSTESGSSITPSSSSNTGGVCLHVCDNQVSVELCSLCARNAAQESSVRLKSEQRIDHTYVK